MFRCELTGQISKPGEPSHKFVVKTRSKRYTETRWDEEERRDVEFEFFGSEIIREITLTPDTMAKINSGEITSGQIAAKLSGKKTKKLHKVYR